MVGIPLVGDLSGGRGFTYVDVLRQQLIADLVLVDDVVVQSTTSQHGAEQEAEESGDPCLLANVKYVLLPRGILSE